MNWLDFAVATPTVGLLCEPRLQFPHEMVAAVRPVLEKWNQQHPNLLVFIPGTASLIHVKLGDGFVCDLLGNAVTTTFLYESKLVDNPAALPTINNPDVQKYSELLARAAEHTASICEKLTAPPVVFTRIGVVADCRIDEQSLPPGITKFIEHVGRPWSVRPTIFTGTITVDLPHDEKWTYRCHHTLDVNSVDRPRDVRMKLDWQMLPAGRPRPLSSGTAGQLFKDACVKANKYFEKFGGGGLSYAAE